MVAEQWQTIQAIGEISENGFLICDRDSKKINYANEAFYKMFQVTEEEVARDSKVFYKRLSLDDVDYLEACFHALSTRRSITNIEFSGTEEDGTLKFFSLDAYIISEQFLFCQVKDISRQKKHEQYITDFGAQKDALLEMLSHNLSSPLLLTKRVLSALDKAYRANQASDISNHIKFIEESTSHCINIIHDFLKEEHFVSKRIVVRKSRFDAIQKVKIIVDQFKESYRGNDLRFESVVDKLFVTNDDVKFLQIVNNLISNALKFTPANCIVEVKVEETEDYFTVIVKDDGIGIPKHLQPLIFHKYTPAGRTGLQGEKSLGVGLSIVKTLVELMKGTIRFESQENKGATFYVTFPKHL
jgi:two-component system sensor histidine kinase VicK